MPTTSLIKIFIPPDELPLMMRHQQFIGYNRQLPWYLPRYCKRIEVWLCPAQWECRNGNVSESDKDCWRFDFLPVRAPLA